MDILRKFIKLSKGFDAGKDVITEVYYEDIKSLNLALDNAEKMTKISDDAFRNEVSKIFYNPKDIDIPDDPFSVEYSNKQFELYEEITGKSYSSFFEKTPFEFNHEIKQPYPYGTKSTNTVGDALIGYGYIIKNLPIMPNSRVLEVGSGYGTLSVHLAPMNVDLTCIDIDRRLLDFVAHRVANFNHRSVFVESDIHDFQAEKKFDIVVFYESFHHCYDHLKVMKKVGDLLADDGVVVFAAEPIMETTNITLPYPWGLRMDGLSLRCIRNFGWFELGFTKSYFFSMLDNLGWSYEERGIPGYPYTHMVMAKKNLSH